MVQVYPSPEVLSGEILGRTFDRDLEQDIKKNALGEDPDVRHVTLRMLRFIEASRIATAEDQRNLMRNLENYTIYNSGLERDSRGDLFVKGLIRKFEEEVNALLGVKVFGNTGGERIKILKKFAEGSPIIDFEDYEGAESLLDDGGSVEKVEVVEVPELPLSVISSLVLAGSGPSDNKGVIKTLERSEGKRFKWSTDSPLMGKDLRGVLGERFKFWLDPLKKVNAIKHIGDVMVLEFLVWVLQSPEHMQNNLSDEVWQRLKSADLGAYIVEMYKKIGSAQSVFNQNRISIEYY